jgi:hypothetical protein
LTIADEISQPQEKLNWMPGTTLSTGGNFVKSLIDNKTHDGYQDNYWFCLIDASTC